MSIEAARLAKVMYEIYRTSGFSRGSCAGALEEPCHSGCWFLLSDGGCKQGGSCSHCHQETCCLMADLKRKETRRQHSRMRPSKKKRDRLVRGRCNENDCGSDTATTAGWEMSHSASGSLTPPALSGESTAAAFVDLHEIQALLDLIQGT